MCELKTYGEPIEILPNRYGNDYRTIVLVKRSNVDCPNLSKEEFISMIEEDYRTAIKIANNLLDKEFEENKPKKVEEARRKAIEYANSYYKRESNKKKYIDNVVAREEAQEREHYYDVTSFNFDTYFGRNNGIHDYCIIREKSLPTLWKIYNDLIDKDSYANSFWKEATGWTFNYTSGANSYHSHFRNWFDLILPESKKEEIKENERKLSEAINNFYAGSNYWGD